MNSQTTINPKEKIVKKFDYLGIIILLTVLATTSIISYQLSKLRTEIQIQSIEKVQVIDNAQLDQLCKQFTEQWHAENFAMYIYQPDAPVKTHKELATSSLIDLPLRLQLSDYKELNKNKIEFGSITKLPEFNNVKLGEAYVRIPIYQYSVIVGELYLFYPTSSQIDSSVFDSMIVETQLISQLLR